jgi:hypothetical protein
VRTVIQLLCIGGILLIGAVPRSIASDGELGNEIYVRQPGHAISRVAQEPDPSEVEYWIIYLYAKNVAADGRPAPWAWGAITGKTREKALEELKRSQEFESNYGLLGKTDTCFNPFGPIAVLRGSAHMDVRDTEIHGRLREMQVILGGLEAEYGEVKSIYEAAKRRAGSGDMDKQGSGRTIGETFKEYVKNLLDARERVFKLQERLEHVQGLSGLDTELEQASNMLKESQTAYDKLSHLMSEVAKNKGTAGNHQAAILPGGGGFGTSNTGWLNTRPDGRKEWIFFNADGTARVARLGENGWYDASGGETYRWRVEGSDIIWGKERAAGEWRIQTNGSRANGRYTDGTHDTFTFERMDESPLDKR